jgi:BirA family transcriptional regulator, biotin operon repressor / biotin---[acetyl-CoA-carboxylase] ligase
MNAASITLPAGYRIIAFDSVGSTNDEAKACARAGAAAGTLVWARQQTAGRGRRGRTWVSPPGNLYLSLIARPAGSPARAAQLGFVTALGLGEALLELAGPALPLSYKWPNDVLIGGRKFAGVLLESETYGAAQVDFVVIGVGVNLVAKPQDVEYPATSLLERGVAIAPATLLQSFIEHFDVWQAGWRRDGFAPVREAWLQRAIGVGEEVRARLTGATFFGRFLDLDEEGALLLACADGLRRIAAGEIFPALG